MPRTGGQTFLPVEGGLHGTVRVPGDKSISHRAVLLGAVSTGAVEVSGFLRSADTLATIEAVRALGVAVDELDHDRLVVHGRGWEGLQEPDDVIDVRNAGTLMRLLPGLLASLPFLAVLTGDASIRRRPMARVLEPLAAMGAQVWGRDGDRLPPIVVRGGALTAIDHTMPVASAQVKSCLLLAGLRAHGETTIVEPGPSRDHTERLLRAGGAEVEGESLAGGAGVVRVRSHDGPLELTTVRIPGDLSSAAFLLVAALLIPGSRVTVEDVGLNPTRTGILDVLRTMGAHLEVEADPMAGVEPAGRVTAAYSELVAVDVGREQVPLLIDELPVWALAAARARGTSRLRGAAELRVKESDRLAATAALLRSLGVAVREYPDGLDIIGRPEGWPGGAVASQGDHRLAMVGALAGFSSREGVTVDDVTCIAVSYPSFTATMQGLMNEEGAW